MLHAKLRATFDPEVWTTVLSSASEDFAAERRMLKHQLTTVEQKMQAIVGNFSYVNSPTLLQALEREYEEYEREQSRLETKLANLQRRMENQDAMMELAKHAENVLANWEKMDLNEQRAVAQAFIARIVVTPTGKHRVADVEIQWRDNSSDTFVPPYRADAWVLWTPEEAEILTKLVENKASQVEMAQALPERNWRAIRIKIYEIIDSRSFQIAPKVIRDEETYADYLARLERKEESQRRTGSARWQEEEMQKLDELLQAGATQLEIAAALPGSCPQENHQTARSGF